MVMANIKLLLTINRNYGQALTHFVPDCMSRMKWRNIKICSELKSYHSVVCDCCLTLIDEKEA